MQLYPRLDEYRYTLIQVAELSAVPEKSVRNWAARGVVPIGRRHWLGRLECSMADVIRVAIVGALTTNAAISIEDAAAVAERAMLSVRGLAYPGDTLILVRGIDSRSWIAGWLEEPGGVSASLLRGPHARIPLGPLVDDIHARAGISPSMLLPGLSDVAAGPRAANATSGPGRSGHDGQGSEPAIPPHEHEQD